jgi:hypothetical protein
MGRFYQKVEGYTRRVPKEKDDDDDEEDTNECNSNIFKW